jgi:outer membrane protein insertion porin family
MLALCCITQLSIAQTGHNSKEPAPPAGVIRSVSIEGNHVYDTAEILKVLGLNAGDAATQDAFRSAQSRLLATDLFSNVAYEFRFTPTKPARYEVTYKLSEYEQLFPVQFESLTVPDDAIRGYLKAHVPLYSERILGTETVIRRYRDAIQDFVSQSKPTLKVRGYMASDNPDHPVVIFRPNTPAPTIAGVTVSGNKAIDTPVLQRALNEVAVGQRFSDTRVKEILNNTIKPLYAAKGFVAVTFPKIESEKSKEVEGYVVHIQIQEGPAFHFGSSTFRGGSFTPEEIRPMMHYQKGDGYDITKAEQLRHDLFSSLRREGNLDAKVDLQTQEEDKKLLVNVIYAISPGPMYTFASLQIHGLDIDSEPQIRKLWAPKPGKPFNPEYPDFFLKRVRELGLFDNLGTTKSSFTTDEGTHSVTVNLFFKGAAGEAAKAKKDGLPQPADPNAPQQPPQ